MDQLYELQDHISNDPAHIQLGLSEAHLFRVKHDATSSFDRPAHLRNLNCAAGFTPPVQAELRWDSDSESGGLIARYWIGGNELNRSPKEPYNTDDNNAHTICRATPGPDGSFQGIGKPLAAIFEGRTSGALQRLELDKSTDKALFWARAGKANLRLGNAQEAIVYAGPHGISATIRRLPRFLGRPWHREANTTGRLHSPGRRTKFPFSRANARARAPPLPNQRLERGRSL